MEDPIQEGANWYRYAGNDPINFRDPTGLSQAGNPLNNLFGGFGGNVVRQKNTALRNMNLGPVAPIRSVSTTRLLNQVSTPSYVPSARELSNFGSLSSNFNSFQSVVNRTPHTLGLSGSTVSARSAHSFLDRVGSAISTATTFAGDFGRNYVSYLGTELSTAGQTIVNNGRRAGTFVGDITSGLYYDPAGKATEIGNSVYDAGVGLKNAATYAYNNPGATVSGLATGAGNYLNALTTDPRVSGELLGNFSTTLATGGVTAAGKQVVVRSLTALRSFGNTFRAVDNVVPNFATSPNGIADLAILNSSFVPDTKRVLQNVTNQAAGDVLLNPRLLLPVVGRDRYFGDLVAGSSKADRIFGIGIEGLVGRRILADEGLSSILVRATQRDSKGRFIRSPDFVGIEAEQHRLLEITTLNNVPDHLRRPAGSIVDFVIQPGLRGPVKPNFR